MPVDDPRIECVFDLLDKWRNLPAYQLERRADIYFALFLPDVLDHYLRPRDLAVNPRLIPEFPIRQKLPSVPTRRTISHCRKTENVPS